jgi:hypothetical protein
MVAWAKVAPGMVVCKAHISDPGWGWEEAHVHQCGWSQYVRMHAHGYRQ